ncbi:MAG: hypothetical protein HY070_03570 [Chloroflexi bacterium]|nr:hypothetical protein [Chloroflexota bacterium]MBI3741279.1 hypothetical protein [Chloroflexota bacterium]
MVWRKWNVIVVLILANYLVLATLATLVFPESNGAPPARAANPTFTPGPTELRRVSPLPYDFITPTAPRVTATRFPTASPAGPTVTLIRPTPTETPGFVTPAPAVGSTGATSTPTPTPTR